MSDTHPVIRWRASTWPGYHDVHASVRRRLGEWDALVAQIEALQPDDPTAEDLLRQGAALVTAITTDAGPVHGWLLSARTFLYQHSVRLLPVEKQFNAPGWREDF